MKTIFWIPAILLLFCFNSGCDSDGDFFDPPDNTPIIPFINLGVDLNDYLWDVNFGRTAYSLGEPHTIDEENDFKAMLRDTLLQSAYCDIVYDILQNFSLISISDNVYTERSRKSTITVSGNTFTLTTEYYGYIDNPEVYEKLNAVMLYDNSLKTWSLKIYRGTDQENIWLVQEGSSVGNVWYAVVQLDDAGTTYRSNFMITGSDIPANVTLSISGQETTDALADGTLYSGGISATNDEWSEFSNFELTPSYEFTE